MQNRFVLIPEQRANSSESTIIRIAPWKFQKQSALFSFIHRFSSKEITRFICSPAPWNCRPAFLLPPKHPWESTLHRSLPVARHNTPGRLPKAHSRLPLPDSERHSASVLHRSTANLYSIRDSGRKFYRVYHGSVHVSVSTDRHSIVRTRVRSAPAWSAHPTKFHYSVLDRHTKSSL